MKIYVDTIPENPNWCSFSLLPQFEYDEKLLPNCLLKCNSFPTLDGHPFSYVPTKFTCSLINDKECPFLKRLKCE